MNVGMRAVRETVHPTIRLVTLGLPGGQPGYHPDLSPAPSTQLRAAELKGLVGNAHKSFRRNWDAYGEPTSDEETPGNWMRSGTLITETVRDAANKQTHKCQYIGVVTIAYDPNLRDENKKLVALGGAIGYLYVPGPEVPPEKKAAAAVTSYLWANSFGRQPRVVSNLLIAGNDAALYEIAALNNISEDLVGRFIEVDPCRSNRSLSRLYVGYGQEMGAMVLPVTFDYDGPPGSVSKQNIMALPGRDGNYPVRKHLAVYINSTRKVGWYRNQGQVRDTFYKDGAAERNLRTDGELRHLVGNLGILAFMPEYYGMPASPTVVDLQAQYKRLVKPYFVAGPKPTVPIGPTP